jgi:hypothetical protein
MTFALRLSNGRRPGWLFSSGPVGDPNRKLVQQMGADAVELPTLIALTKPREHRVFAGRLVKANASRVQRISLSIFRGFEGDWRDWAEIQRWASAIADALTPSSGISGSARGPRAPSHTLRQQQARSRRASAHCL